MYTDVLEGYRLSAQQLYYWRSLESGHELRVQGVIRIEGRVAGNVISGVQIRLSEGSVVEGDLRTREAVLGGEVHGNVIASERVEVQPTAAVHGDIITPRLLIQEGGRVNGGVRMESLVEAEVG